MQSKDSPTPTGVITIQRVQTLAEIPEYEDGMGKPAILIAWEVMGEHILEAGARNDFQPDQIQFMYEGRLYKASVE